MTNGLCSVRRVIGVIAVCSALGATAAGKAAAGEKRKDERILLALSDIVLTIDADSIQVVGQTRRLRSHTYLPIPDENGNIAYAANLEVDCARKLSRYTGATGTKADGKIERLDDDAEFTPIVVDTPVSVLRNQTCPIQSAKWDVGGVTLLAPPQAAARAIFALVQLGISSSAAAELASRTYDYAPSLLMRLNEQKVPKAKHRQVIEALGVLVEEEAKPPLPIVPQAAAVRSGKVGEYTHAEMELAAGLWLKADATFEYFLTVGSLDEAARGTWSADGDQITLKPAKIPAKQGEVDFTGWRVFAKGSDLTVIREGQPMLFERRKN